MVSKDADTLEVTGNLTMHGVSRQITFPVSVLGTMKAPRGEKAGFEATFTVDRKEYGIVWNNVLDSGAHARRRREDPDRHRGQQRGGAGGK